MTQQLANGARQVIQKLQEGGFEAYLVGGCVRDAQLNRPVKDYDIASSARPEQVQSLFRKTIPTGLQHGTVTVQMNGKLYEVTTFRKEAGYEDFRRPTEVQYIDSLYEDLQRRDFTMNAMAMDLSGKLIDPFNGMADLKSGMLRCVGDAEERFREDALRMLRCVRFAAEYGLEIADDTWQALLKQASLLSHIAMERVRIELERMVAGASPDRAVRLLASSGLLTFAKQALKLAELRPERLSPPWERLSEPSLKWAYLYLCLQASPRETERELRALTFSKQQVDRIRSIVSAVSELGEGIRKGDSTDLFRLETNWKLASLRYGKDALRAVVEVARTVPGVLVLAGLPEPAAEAFTLKGLDWLEDMPVSAMDQLDINGKELLACTGKPAGPWMAAVLKHLLQEAALKRLVNEKEALLAEAVRFANDSLGK